MSTRKFTAPFRQPPSHARQPQITVPARQPAQNPLGPAFYDLTPGPLPVMKLVPAKPKVPA
jgi:hypothetical protein